MNRLILIAILLIGIAGCTTEQTAGVVDEERASEANTQLGIGYMQQGRYELALNKLGKAVNFNPRNAQAHQFKAELHRRLKQYDKAKEEYELALDLKKSDSLLDNNYGVFLCEIKDFAGAIRHFKKVIDDPLYATKDQTYENLGLCTLEQGNVYEAEEYFRKALQLNGRLAKSLLNMAQISYDKGDYNGAYGYYTRFLPLSEQVPPSLWLGYLIERAMGNKSVAATYAASLKAKFPDAKETNMLRKLESSKGKRQ